MNPVSKKAIKGLLKKYGVHPSKGLGQNFLVSEVVLGKIIKAADLGPEDTVLEIGPGIGNLTQELSKKVKRVVAIEKDPRMAEILNDLVKNFEVKNVKVVKGDILKVGDDSISKLVPDYKLVANLPYYIVSPVIRKFLEIKNQPREMILMTQKEVAQRICARPPRMNLLSVSVQLYAEPKIVFFVSKRSFWPRPKVDGAIIKISKIKSQKSKMFSKLFFRIARAGFSQPRKQILNNLSRALKLDKEKINSWLYRNDISPSRRAETLSVDEWIKLAKNFTSFSFPEFEGL